MSLKQYAIPVRKLVSRSLQSWQGDERYWWWTSFWKGYFAEYCIIRAEFVLFLACCLHWTSDRKIPRNFAWTLPCTCPYLHTNTNCFICLSEVQGVSKILSKAVSCLDKLDWLGRDPQGGVDGRRQESKTGWLVSRKREGEQKKKRGWNVCLLDCS